MTEQDKMSIDSGNCESTRNSLVTSLTSTQTLALLTSIAAAQPDTIKYIAGRYVIKDFIYQENSFAMELFESGSGDSLMRMVASEDFWITPNRFNDWPGMYSCRRRYNGIPRLSTRSLLASYLSGNHWAWLTTEQVEALLLYVQNDPLSVDPVYYHGVFEREIDHTEYGVSGIWSVCNNEVMFTQDDTLLDHCNIREAGRNFHFLFDPEPIKILGDGEFHVKVSMYACAGKHLLYISSD